MNKQLLYPVLVQILLTSIILMRTAYCRLQAIKNGHTKIKEVALGQNAWPEAALKAANSFNNQFQLPILFYVAVILTLLLQINSQVLQILTWVFVTTRIFHAYVHVTSNHVPTRFRFFLAGVITLNIIWIFIAVQIFMN